MKTERIRERMQPLLQPLRDLAREWRHFDRTWPDCATSVGETFVHAVAAMAVTRNARLGDERLTSAALDAADPAWLKNLADEMDDFVDDVACGESQHPRLRSVVFADGKGHRYGALSMKTTRAQISVFGAGRESLPMWLSRRSVTPILDPDTVELTAEDCQSCLQAMRQELAAAGVGEATTATVEIGRCFSDYTFIPDASTRTIRASWSNDTTALSVMVPGQDLTREAPDSRSMARVDAYAIVHGPAKELTKQLRWHAERVAEIMATRSGLEAQVSAVRAMVADAATSKGAPPGGIVEECRITQAGSVMQVECAIVAYDGDSFRRSVCKVNYQGATCEEVEQVARPHLERQCAEYGRHFRRLGRPPCTATTGADVNLAAYRIDRPLMRLIETRVPGRLSEIVTDLIVKGETPKDVRPGFPGPMNGVSIHLENGCVRGYFDLSEGVAWRGGKVRMADVSLPQSMRTSLTGVPLVDVVRHDFFDHGLVVTSTSTRDRSSGGQVTYLHVGGAAASLADAIAGE